LGRQPLDSFIKTQVMLYYSRIQSDGINPLVKEAFNINKNISNENIYTWYTFATEIFIHGTPLQQKYLYMLHLYNRNIYT
jgi:hypothetical protein